MSKKTLNPVFDQRYDASSGWGGAQPLDASDTEGLINTFE